MEGHKTEAAIPVTEALEASVTEVASVEATSEAAEIEKMSDSFEPWEENAVEQAYAEGWEHEQQLPEVRDYLEEKQEYAEAVRQWDEYIEGTRTAEGIAIDPEELERSRNTQEDMQRKLVEVSANYPGDWTALLYQRLSNPAYKAKFIAQKTEAMKSLNRGEPGLLDKAEERSGYYQEQIDGYDERLAKVFSSVRVGNASEFHYEPQHVGTIEQLGKPAVVFNDATNRDGTPLTTRHKEIILPHEIGHALRDYVSPDEGREIRLVLDQDALAALSVKYKSQEEAGTKMGKFRPEYLKQPHEIIERMAQFKNYFGMGASEQFTKKHLDHIRNRYVTDTGLDNSVSDLLSCVTPRTEQAFLKVINKYPI